MHVLIIDPHPIFRRGLAASLVMMDDVERVVQVGSVREALASAALAAADVVVIDCAAPGGRDFVSTVREATSAAVLICTADCGEASVWAALREGVIGYLRKDALTHEILESALCAVASGTSVLAEGLLAGVVQAAEPDRAPGPMFVQLAERERDVLTLIAEGLPTREIAERLNYSERTVKNVLHDTVTKLNARSRSQAVAHAVREGLI